MHRATLALSLVIALSASVAGAQQPAPAADSLAAPKDSAAALKGSVAASTDSSAARAPVVALRDSAAPPRDSAALLADAPIPSASDITAPQVAWLLRSRGVAGPAIEALTGKGGARPREVLDEIADTLAALVIQTPGSDTAAMRIRRQARQALLTSVTPTKGVPYDGAAERLFRIAEQASDVAERGGALYALTRVPNRTDALQFLRRAATSDSPVAHAAVGFLARNMGEEGLATVKQLHQEGGVVQPWAVRELAGIAQHHGW